MSAVSDVPTPAATDEAESREKPCEVAVGGPDRRKCGRVNAEEVTLACVHEHFWLITVCVGCLAAPIFCVECHGHGHECQMQALASAVSS